MPSFSPSPAPLKQNRNFGAREYFFPLKIFSFLAVAAVDTRRVASRNFLEVRFL
jgi:hypothetical protein